MNVIVYQVNYLFHYSPFYLALNRVLKKQKKSFLVSFISTNNDKESIDLFEKGIMTNTGDLHVLLTGTVDLKKRIEEYSKDVDVDYFFRNVILWTSLIRKVPITIWQRTKKKLYQTLIQWPFMKKGQLYIGLPIST